jgi:hypothetical protein
MDWTADFSQKIMAKLCLLGGMAIAVLELSGSADIIYASGGKPAPVKNAASIREANRDSTV